MLIGEYQSQVGDKNRVAIPKRLRDQCVGQIILTKGYDHTLLLTDESRWKYIVDEINKRPLFSETTRTLKRYFLGGTVEVDPDNQGRFVIPESLLSFALIGTKIVFIGVGEWIEIWNADRWDEYSKGIASDLSEIAHNLYHDGIVK